MRENSRIIICKIPNDTVVSAVRFCVEKFGEFNRYRQDNCWAWCPFSNYSEFYFSKGEDAIVFKMAMGV